jgi:hypothetical protein
MTNKELQSAIRETEKMVEACPKESARFPSLMTHYKALLKEQLNRAIKG